MNVLSGIALICGPRRDRLSARIIPLLARATTLLAAGMIRIRQGEPILAGLIGSNSARERPESALSGSSCSRSTASGFCPLPPFRLGLGNDEDRVGSRRW